MPYRFEKKKIPKKFDRRVKLTDSQKDEIYNLYNVYGAYSQRELAAMYKVSRRLIMFIVYPHKKEEMLKRREERGGWKQYYTKDKNRVRMQNHREYKKELDKKGLLE